MAGLLKNLHIPFGFNLWNMADGNQYTIEEENTDLTPELAESDRKTDEAYEERFKQTKKGNAGKSKEAKFKEENKVNKEQLKATPAKSTTKENQEKEIVD